MQWYVIKNNLNHNEEINNEHLRPVTVGKTWLGLNDESHVWMRLQIHMLLLNIFMFFSNFGIQRTFYTLLSIPMRAGCSPQ